MRYFAVNYIHPQVFAFRLPDLNAPAASSEFRSFKLQIFPNGTHFLPNIFNMICANKESCCQQEGSCSGTVC